MVVKWVVYWVEMRADWTVVRLVGMRAGKTAGLMVASKVEKREKGNPPF